MPTVITQGAASAKGYGFGARATAANYIEDVFSTYLYTGTGASQTITNGIDLAGKGGLVWIKGRSGATDHALYDTARGATFDLASNLTTAQTTQSTGLTSFNGAGFSIGALAKLNTSAATYASWSFRKQPKFFDVVNYSGNGANRTIAHNLGSVPGCIIIKLVNVSGANWAVYHRSLANTQYTLLNTTAAAATGATYWNSTTPTSSVFSLGTSTDVNGSGGNYVAYIFASFAGGFGATGTDEVISCGSYTGNGSATGPTVTLGYEPQWLLIKRTDTTGDWNLIDNMRGFVVGGTDSELNPNLANAESSGTFVTPTATGFQLNTTAAGYNANTGTYIYIAIRRGPMKTPTTGTSVFMPFARTGADSTTVDNVGFPADSVFFKNRFDIGAYPFTNYDRLRNGYKLQTANDGAETITGGYSSLLWSTEQNTLSIGTGRSESNYDGGFFSDYVFRRAPGFFDVVCYTGTGANRTVSHNLGVVPELMIVKGRSGATDWQVYSSGLANTEYLVLNTTAAKATGATRWNSTAPTSSVFSLGTATAVNTSAATYVAYLFASVAGVSKVGSYTGTGTTNQIDCGFTGGARFVLIKRTDSTGDWYVWDSARGIVAGNDPYLLFNSGAVEVTNTDYVDTYSAGFEISSTAPAAINANGGTYIFLAIA